MSHIVPDLTQEESIEATFPERPWITILFKPRSTMRAIVESDPKRYVIILAILLGIANTFSNSPQRVIGENLSLPLFLIFTIVAGAISGLVGLYVSGAILTWTGSWFGGKSSSEYVRAAMAWSSVPAIITLFFIPFMILLYGNELFTSITPRMDNNPIPVFLFLIANFIFFAWWYFLFWKSYAEVQEFSLPRAFIAIIAPVLIMGAVLFGCQLLFTGMK